MHYACAGMLDSWEQPRVGGPFQRFSGPFRDLVARVGSVTQLIIAINVIVFFIQLICSAAHFPYVEDYLALSADGLRRGFLWQPITYMFLAGIWHILINLFILWFFGREVEYFIGPKSFTRLYFMAGIFGAALWFAFNFHSYVPVVGASAAVLGCVIAFATLFPDREVTLLVFFILPVSLRAKYLALIAIAFDVVPLLQGTDAGVAHLAHLGGAAFGYLYIKQLGIWYDAAVVAVDPEHGRTAQIPPASQPAHHVVRGICPRGDRPDSRQDRSRRDAKPDSP